MLAFTGGNASLLELSLQNLQITDLETINLSTLRNLGTLSIPHNQISTIPTGYFSNMSRLRALYLNNNQLKSLPGGILSGHNFYALDLSNNQLSGGLSSTTFVGVSIDGEGGFLDLSANGLSSLPAGLFGAWYYWTLKLNDNYLSGGGGLRDALNNSALSEGVYLDGLFLDNNQLTTIPEDVQNIQQIGTLSLNNNHISNLANLPSNLSSLYLNNNQLTSIPTDISKVPYLYGLYLDDNQITDLSNLPSYLSVLSLNNNQLTSIPAGINSAINLYYLFLDGNQIADRSGAPLSGNKNLYYLSMQNNQLTQVPLDIRSGATNLHYLYLQNNFIAELPEGVFSGNMGAISYIYLQNNALHDLPSDISTYPSNLVNVGYNCMSTRDSSSGTVGFMTSKYGSSWETQQYLCLKEISYDPPQPLT